MKEVVALLRNFRAAQALVDAAQWSLDLLKEETKQWEKEAQSLAEEAKRQRSFWGDDWGTHPGKCFYK